MVKERWTKGGIEPGLGETLADPIVIRLMEADRITCRDVLAATHSRMPPSASVRAERLRRSCVTAAA